jgi:predicted nucleic acid-binding protein
MAYIDTSVLVACYVPEAGSAKAQRAVARGGRAAISLLVEVELASALSRKVRSGELSEADGRKVLRQFQRHVADGVYEMFPLAAEEYGVACDWLARFDTSLRTLDALHLAVAFCNRLTLVTADETLARGAAALGVSATTV